MTLIRRKPTKGIKISEAGELLGYKRDAVKQIARREGWTMWRNGDGPTNPWMVLQAEVEAFKAKRLA